MRRWKLESDDEHPVRPNLPFFRHLTYDEIHAIQLGIVGLPIGAAYAEGLVELSVWFTVAIMGIVFGISKYEKQGEKRRASGVIADVPWYFTTSYFLWVTSGVYLSATFFPPPTLAEVVGGGGGVWGMAAALASAVMAVVRDDAL